MTLILISHIFACLWIWVAKIEKTLAPELETWIDSKDLLD
jgi:hypothetical protein